MRAALYFAACATILLAFFVIGLFGAVQGGNASTSGRVRLVATITDVRTDGSLYQGARKFVFMRLWQRPLRGTPIGHAFLACVYMGDGGVFGGGVWSCQATYRMPLGYITAAGVLHNFRQYTLAVTGGTGLYSGQGGTSFTLRTTDGVAGVYMSLT